MTTETLRVMYQNKKKLQNKNMKCSLCHNFTFDDIPDSILFHSSLYEIITILLILSISHFKLFFFIEPVVS